MESAPLVLTSALKTGCTKLALIDVPYQDNPGQLLSLLSQNHESQSEGKSRIQHTVKQDSQQGKRLSKILSKIFGLMPSLIFVNLLTRHANLSPHRCKKHAHQELTGSTTVRYSQVQINACDGCKA